MKTRLGGSVKVIKKSQIAVLSILLMVGVAGYINYKYNPTREKNLGQTMYVNGKDSLHMIKLAFILKISQILKWWCKTTSASNNNSEDSALAVFKYDRDNMYSELSENYTSVIKNEKSSEAEIKEYQQKLSELIKQKT